jgi:hypothetical protein
MRSVNLRLSNSNSANRRFNAEKLPLVGRGMDIKFSSRERQKIASMDIHVCTIAHKNCCHCATVIPVFKGKEAHTKVPLSVCFSPKLSCVELKHVSSHGTP